MFGIAVFPDEAVFPDKNEATMTEITPDRHVNSHPGRSMLLWAALVLMVISTAYLGYSSLFNTQL